MKAEIPKTYEPKDHEDTIYLTWEESGLFNTDTCIEKGIITPDAPPFSIVLPPPNVTGTLHLGHAAMLAIEDIMVRYHRMRGDRTLWIPGTDHAAIATQEKVERTIWNEEQKTRHDFGREIFLDRVKKFAQDSHDTIVNQCKKMGASLDWSREAYTLDEARNRAVNEAFRRMFEDGIIYRGPRIVNWDPKFQTTVSDDEVERREEKVPLYYLQYGPFVISTARPETKFGDKYVVVHPDDERYRDYAHGQTIENIEWINGKITATVIKDEAIDMEFGTGAMTITPWHDATDFDIATRHNLDKEQIIGYDGKLLDIAGEDFQGLDITQARKKIVEKLQEKNLVVKTDEDYLHNITVNSRGGGIIEPQIKEQWFVDVNKEFEREGKSTSLKSLMQHAVRSGNVTIIPERFEKTYFHWIDNLRDWCISRQIWFGHRIPVWYRGKDVYCGINAPEGAEWEQDPDTLDTWFSSGLWTFSTLGWGSDEEKWQREKVYHPTSVLETGYDILFFWVARMILMSEYLLGEAPFKTVYLHGLVRDEQGRKMSKSIGNVIDPLEMTAKYGTDAVRLALVIGSTPGNDIRLGEEKIATFRNFTNKLWNIGRYILQQPEKTDASKTLSDADHWILSRLGETVCEVTHLIKSYQFSLAGETLRDFTWNDFADWYVEVHKVEGNNTVLKQVFETLLTLWHPFMPFVTEALWSHLNKNTLLLTTPWSQGVAPESISTGKSFATIIDIITRIRAIRATYRLDAKRPVTATFVCQDATFIETNSLLLKRLARIGELSIVNGNTKPIPHAAKIIITDTQIFLHLEGLIDINKEQTRLKAELDKAEAFIKNTSSRLANASFIAKAPPELIKNTQSLLEEQQRKRIEIQSALKALL
ncbi:MAG: valine--tRNA ligase [Candidatus Moraniibacteriota bacterium]